MEEEIQEECSDVDPRDEEIYRLKQRLAGTDYHLECCELVGNALRSAGESQRRPVVMIVRGGGYGDNVQACFAAESLRRLYPTAYIIMVVRNHAGLQKMLSNACTMTGRRPLIDHWCNTMGVIHHPWFFKPFARTVDLYVDMLYAPLLVFGNPERLAPTEKDPDDIKKLRTQMMATFAHHKMSFEARWERDEWLRSMHERSPLSHQDWIKLRRNLLEWQFDVMGLPYLDKIPLATTDISAHQQHFRMRPGEYVTFAGGAGGRSTRKEYPFDRSPVGHCDEGSWLEILRYIHKRGLGIVQLGMRHEREMPRQLGVSLVGETQDMDEATAWVKDARFHIGIEGGLVHFARCVDTPCIVVHGPTGKCGYGYKDNLNIGHDRCYDCFWTTADWYSQPCPHGHATCVNFPDTNEVKAAVDEMLERTKEKREKILKVPQRETLGRTFNPKEA